MKKILFMIINMNIGGTEKALLNMLETLPRDQYEVTLLMLEEYGGFLNQIPSDIQIKYLDDYKDIRQILNQPLHKVIKEFIYKRKIITALILLSVYSICKVTKERSLVFWYALRNYKKIEEFYDVAIAYAGPMDFITYFVVHKIKATFKVQWIHFDITQIGFNKNFARKYYKKFNRIFVVSDEGKDKLVQVIPQIKDRTKTFYNRISREKIQERAQLSQGFQDSYDGVRILTVGRIAREKGQDLCIEACKQLKDDGYKVRWYCVGDGNYRKTCEQLIQKYRLEQDFILLGAKNNPYPYMRECDYYVQSSRHEGYCITLAEAKIFNKPIVTTNFTGAKEQILDEKTGLVVEVDANAIYTALKKLLEGTVTLEKEVG